MATTTNYGWTTPDDTDLVKDGAAAIRTLGSSVDTTTKNLNPETTLGDIAYRSATANTNTRLAIGTTGQVLTVAGGVPTWATSDDANAIQNAIVDAKGDIVAASAADTPARLAVGTDNQRLVAASGETTGLKYVSDTQNTVIDAEGDLLVGDAADAVQRLAIGSNAQVLTVDTSVDGKIKWATPAGGGGKVLQVVEGTLTGSVTSSSSSYADIGLSVSITPASSSNKVLIFAAINGCEKRTTDTSLGLKLFRGATEIMMSSSGYTGAVTRNNHGAVALNKLDTPSTTSATTYKIQFASEGNANIVGVNQDGTGANTVVSTIIAMEIGA
jgi:hypothetical protein